MSAVSEFPLLKFQVISSMNNFSASPQNFSNCIVGLAFKECPQKSFCLNEEESWINCFRYSSSISNSHWSCWCWSRGSWQGSYQERHRGVSKIHEQQDQDNWQWYVWVSYQGNIPITAEIIYIFSSLLLTSCLLKISTAALLSNFC